MRLDAPPSIEAGRYTARVTLTFPNGTVANASWSFEAGPWVRLALGEPTVGGREGRIEVTNAGGIAIDRLVVEADGASPVALDVGAAHLTPTASGSRVAFSNVGLAPGASGTLVVRLPDGPLHAGEHATRVRIFALAAVTPS